MTLDPSSETRTAVLDGAPSTAAIDLARATLRAEVGPAVVGEYAEARPEGEGVLTLLFACTDRAYRGWQWAVTVVTVADEAPTVDELVLLPGEEAIVAPEWLPWRERIQPGDLSPGDILPADEDDDRLVPAYLSGDPEVDEALASMVADEVGLGRARVLSLEGRDLAAARWYDGEGGPSAPIAQSAPARCGGCGFLVRIAGPLATMFGVCANEYANDDGRVVSLDHGCGAHSEAQLRKKQLPPPLPEPVFDTLTPVEMEPF